jgi:hypothetical protein
VLSLVLGNFPSEKTESTLYPSGFFRFPEAPIAFDQQFVGLLVVGLKPEGILGIKEG